MTDRGKLLALAEAVAASNPEEAERDELGVQVMEALEIASYITDDGDPCLSMDGAIAIVPKGWEWGCGFKDATGQPWAWAGLPRDGRADWDPMIPNNAATPALALTAAALRAQAEALA